MCLLCCYGVYVMLMIMLEAERKVENRNHNLRIPDVTMAANFIRLNGFIAVAKYTTVNKGNNKINKLQTIFQR